VLMLVSGRLPGGGPAAAAIGQVWEGRWVVDAFSGFLTRGRWASRPAVCHAPGCWYRSCRLVTVSIDTVRSREKE
jgi:hypothetical protein